MTVCVAVKVRDCMVFAADSAVSMMATTPGGESVVTNVWNHGIKVYNLYKGLPIVAMSSGAGNLGERSVGELVKYMRHELTHGVSPDRKPLNKTSYDMEQVARRAASFLADVVTNETLEFFVGGYGSAAVHGEVWRFAFDKGALEDPARAFDGTSYIVWAGSGSVALHRLVIGMDPRLRGLLVQHGLQHDDVTDIEGELFNPLVDAAMPVQNAIDLAAFLVDVAKGYSAFAPGSNVVGGETDIATVTRHEGFKWIRRKHYYDVRFNRTDTDHA